MEADCDSRRTDKTSRNQWVKTGLRFTLASAPLFVAEKVIKAATQASHFGHLQLLTYVEESRIICPGAKLSLSGFTFGVFCYKLDFKNDLSSFGSIQLYLYGIHCNETISDVK